MDIDDGISAVRFARSIVRSETGSPADRPPLPGSFSEPAGVFVTLRTHPDGDLRGCIGIPYPVMPLRDALEEAARSACHDPRFPDLSPEEVGSVTVEVTVLDVPKVIECDGRDLPSRIVIGRDGLMISFRGRRGLLLPQVPVEQGWNQIEYLEALCMKAGLPAGTWRSEGVTVSSFGGRVFHETSPSGTVEEG